MYTDTITLFNAYVDIDGNITWYPHVLHKVNLVADKASITARYGAETKDNASLHVKFAASDKGLTIEDIPYFSPKEWAAQVNDELPDSITFSDGSENGIPDFFIQGEYESTAPINDNDYLNGFYAELNSLKDYCYAITSVSTPYKLIPHFEIMAK